MFDFISQIEVVVFFSKTPNYFLISFVIKKFTNIDHDNFTVLFANYSYNKKWVALTNTQKKSLTHKKREKHTACFFLFERLTNTQ